MSKRHFRFLRISALTFSISRKQDISDFGKQIQLVTKYRQLRVPLSCTAMTGLRRCCSDSVSYLSYLHTHRPAHKSNGSRSMPDPHAHGIRAYTRWVSRPTRIFYVRVAHTPIFILAYCVLPNRIRPSANIKSNSRSAACQTLYPIGYESKVNPPYYTRSVIKIKTAFLRTLYCLFIPKRINPFALIYKTDLGASQSVTRASVIYLSCTVWRNINTYIPISLPQSRFKTALACSR